MDSLPIRWLRRLLKGNERTAADGREKWSAFVAERDPDVIRHNLFRFDRISGSARASHGCAVSDPATARAHRGCRSRNDRSRTAAMTFPAAAIDTWILAQHSISSPNRKPGAETLRTFRAARQDRVYIDGPRSQYSNTSRRAFETLSMTPARLRLAEACVRPRLLRSA